MKHRMHIWGGVGGGGGGGGLTQDIPNSVSVSAQDGIVALEKSHTRSARLSAVSLRLPAKQCPCLPV